MASEFRGRNGELRCGYQVAARLVDWKLAHGRVDAIALDEDDFWLEGGGPFQLHLDVGRTDWTWPDAEVVDRNGGRMVVRITGSPHVRPLK